MADAADLKSEAQKWACQLESRPRHHFYEVTACLRRLQAHR